MLKAAYTTQMRREEIEVGEGQDLKLKHDQRQRTKNNRHTNYGHESNPRITKNALKQKRDNLIQAAKV